MLAITALLQGLYQRSAYKLVVIFFFENYTTWILLDCIKQGRALNNEWYVETLTKLKETIMRKRRS